MGDLMVTADGPLFLGPYADDAPDTEVVRPRNVQLVPSHYAAMLVHRDNITPRTAYRELSGAIQVDGNMDACADILSWIRVACTLQRRGGNASRRFHRTQRPTTGPLAWWSIRLRYGKGAL